MRDGSSLIAPRVDPNDPNQKAKKARRIQMPERPRHRKRNPVQQAIVKASPRHGQPGQASSGPA